MATRNPDREVPPSQLLACTLWKCHEFATQGPGDGSITWWTLTPFERMWWGLTADYFRDSLTHCRPELWEMLRGERRNDPPSPTRAGVESGS